jgi:hypothetical protein
VTARCAAGRVPGGLLSPGFLIRSGASGLVSHLIWRNRPPPRQVRRRPPLGLERPSPEIRHLK